MSSHMQRPSLADLLTAVAYGALGTILCWTRVAGLDRSLWLDEVITVEIFVRRGPDTILAGPYLPNNHELFSLLAWLTISAVGESEAALRLWSVLPFLAGVAIVTAWLHVRVGRLSGVLFLFLATGSPLLLDITPAARGYGLAFLAMGIVVVSALETARSGGTAWIVALVAAGLIGTLTLPNFVIAYTATSAVLLFDAAVRRRVLLGLAASGLAVLAWYAPHLGDLSSGTYGELVELPWLVTSPIDQTLIPALLWYDGVVPSRHLVLLPTVVLALVVMASSPLLARGRTAAILVSGVVATMLVVWYLSFTVVPRFLSFLLVPLFMLAASGAGSILGRLTTRPPLVRTLVVLTSIAALAVVFASAALEISRLPREANKDVALLVHAEAEPTAPIYVNVIDPRPLSFYLRDRLLRHGVETDVRAICESGEPAVLVSQPFRVPPLDVDCLEHSGARSFRIAQYDRGEEMRVWFVAPR